MQNNKYQQEKDLQMLQPESVNWREQNSEATKGSSSKGSLVDASINNFMDTLKNEVNLQKERVNGRSEYFVVIADPLCLSVQLSRIYDESENVVERGKRFTHKFLGRFNGIII